MSHPLILVPRTHWSPMDKLRALCFPRRTVHFSTVSKVDELMQKRFGGLAVCGGCARKYRGALSRWGYYRHPDITFQGNACDFCERVFGHLALWPKEEHAYPTQQEYTDQSARVGIRSAPHAYDTRRRVAACSR